LGDETGGPFGSEENDHHHLCCGDVSIENASPMIGGAVGGAVGGAIAWNFGKKN
jgi:hypothetical protein